MKRWNLINYLSFNNRTQVIMIYGNTIYLIIKNSFLWKKEIKSKEKETYISPDIEVVNIEIEQNILAVGSSGDLEGMPGEIW